MGPDFCHLDNDRSEVEIVCVLLMTLLNSLTVCIFEEIFGKLSTQVFFVDSLWMLCKVRTAELLSAARSVLFQIEQAFLEVCYLLQMIDSIHLRSGCKGSFKHGMMGFWSNV